VKNVRKPQAAGGGVAHTVHKFYIWTKFYFFRGSASCIKPAGDVGVLNASYGNNGFIHVHLERLYGLYMLYHVRAASNTHAHTHQRERERERRTDRQTDGGRERQMTY